MPEISKTQTIVSETMHSAHTVKAIWPLLCPVREYDWIEVWECELIHTHSGFNELGCVFKTSSPTEGGVETWITSRYDHHERIEFIRSNDWRIIRLVIELKSQVQGTTLTWSQYVTPLNKSGVEYAKAKPAAFAKQVKLLEAMLNHFLDKDEMLTIAELGLTKGVNDNAHNRKTG